MWQNVVKTGNQRNPKDLSKYDPASERDLGRTCRHKKHKCFNSIRI